MSSVGVTHETWRFAAPGGIPEILILRVAVDGPMLSQNLEFEVNLLWRGIEVNLNIIYEQCFSLYITHRKLNTFFSITVIGKYCKLIDMRMVL